MEDSHIRKERSSTVVRDPGCQRREDNQSQGYREAERARGRGRAEGVTVRDVKRATAKRAAASEMEVGGLQKTRLRQSKRRKQVKLRTPRKRELGAVW